jgi:putative membrane protein
MSLILSLFIRTLAIIAAAYIVPGVTVSSFWIGLVAAIVLGIVNLLIRPLVLLLTLPINILTLGLFAFIVNALMVFLVSAIVPGFRVRGFGSAILFAIVLWLINWFLSVLALA